jgi:beta-lactam-binding protein with PASTA domain
MIKLPLFVICAVVLATAMASCGNRDNTAGPNRETVTRTPVIYTIPYVVGLKESDAVTKLRRGGLHAQVIHIRVSRRPAGTVVGQRPRAGVVTKTGVVELRIAAARE